MDIRNIGIIILLTFLFLPIVNASSPYLGEFRKNQNIELLQTCFINGTICDTCMISTVTVGSDKILSNAYMTKRTNDFNYTVYSTEIGTHTVSGMCSYMDIKRPFTYTYEITAGSLGFYILIVLLIMGIIIMGFSISEPWFVIIGGMLSMIFGIYIINYGLAGYQDMIITWGVGLFLIGTGAYLSIKSGMELNDL